MLFSVAFACLLSESIGLRLIAAQEPVNLGCFTLPPSGRPPGQPLELPAKSNIDCAQQCDAPIPTGDKRYGFFRPGDWVTINCYCTIVPPPNGDYTACEDGNVYEAWQAESVFTFVNCFSFVCAASFQEFYVDTFDQCIGECFSNNWIITDITSNGQIHCRCGGSYEIPPYNLDDIAVCDNTPNNWRIYRYFGIGPSALARRRQRSLGRRQDAGICPQGLTACKTPNGEGDGYECIDTDADVDSCGGCIYGEYINDGCAPVNNTFASGQDCNALPGVLPPATDCVGGRCIAYKCDPAGYELQNDTCVWVGAENE